MATVQQTRDLMDGFNNVLKSMREDLKRTVAEMQTFPAPAPRRRPSVKPMRSCIFCGGRGFTGFRCDGCGAYQ